MAADSSELSVESAREQWSLVGPVALVEPVNDFLRYLSDRNYSPRTVRAYAFDLLHFTRWVSAEAVALDDVDTDVLLRYLAACRAALLPHQHGGNVYSIRDGRNTGYAPRTVNRRLAALSALFAFRALRDPGMTSPVPRGRETRQTVGERAGLLGHLARPAPCSRLRVREPRELPRGLDRSEVAGLLDSFRTVRDRAIAGLMLFSGLRSCEVLGLQRSQTSISPAAGCGCSARAPRSCACPSIVTSQH
jgi:site-specific recombinase XerD